MVWVSWGEEATPEGKDPPLPPPSHAHLQKGQTHDAFHVYQMFPRTSYRLRIVNNHVVCRLFYKLHEQVSLRYLKNHSLVFV